MKYYLVALMGWWLFALWQLRHSKYGTSSPDEDIAAEILAWLVLLVAAAATAIYFVLAVWWHTFI
jgi:hypothetical protein